VTLPVIIAAKMVKIIVAGILPTVTIAASCSDLCADGGHGTVGFISGTAPACGGVCADCGDGHCYQVEKGSVSDYGHGCATGNKVCCCSKEAQHELQQASPKELEVEVKAQRECRLELKNNADVELIFASDDLPHGCWDAHGATTIKPGEHTEVHAESCGMMTGCEYTTHWKVQGPGFQDLGSMKFHIDSPWSGDAHQDHSGVPSGYILACDSAGAGSGQFTATCSLTKSTELEMLV